MSLVERLKKVSATFWALLVAGLAIFFLGAIAAPKYGRFGGKTRAWQSEAKNNLKALRTAQRSYFQERGTYLADAEKIGFSPEAGNRYAYFLQAGAPAIGNDLRKHPGEAIVSSAQTGCPVTAGRDEAGREIKLGVTLEEKGGFIALAARKDDGKAPYDCWSIASMERVAASGEKILAGEPFQEAGPQ